jgi:hypothetical protein
VKIRDQVLGVLDADRQLHGARADAGPFDLLRREPPRLLVAGFCRSSMSAF